MTRLLPLLLLGCSLISPLFAAVHDLEDGRVRLYTASLSVILDASGALSGQPGTILEGWAEDDRGRVSWGEQRVALAEALAGETVLPFQLIEARPLPAENVLELHGWTEANGDGDRLWVTQRWQPVERSLLVSTVWTPADTCAVLYPQRLRFHDLNQDTVRTLNAAGQQSIAPNHDETWPLQNGFLASLDDATLASFVTSPFLGDFATEDGSVLLHVMRIRESRGLDDPRPMHSILSPGNSVRLDLQLQFDPSVNGLFADGRVLAGFSAHRGSASGTMQFATDAVPYRSSWDVFDDLYDLDTPVYSVFNQLVAIHPEIRYNALAILDQGLDIHNGEFAPDSTGGWVMNNGNISFAPHHASDGDRSCRMEIHADTTCWIRQTVSLQAGDELAFSMDLFTDDVLAPAEPVFVVLDGPGGAILHNERFSVPLDQWTSVASSPLPPITDPGPYRLWIHLDRADGAAYLDNVDLTVIRPGEPDPLHPISNASFETGRTWIVYDSKGDSWWNAHTARCTVLDATPEFQQLLRDWDQASGEGGWQERIKLGLHGCHHNWRADSVGTTGRPEMTGPPEEQRLALESMDWHRRQIGLSDEMMRFWRTPGNRYTPETPHLAMEYGVEMMDYAYEFDRNYFHRQYGIQGGIWWNNSCWWGDGGWGNSLTAMNRTLDAGQIALLGTHPAATYYQYGDQWIFDIFGQMIATHPTAEWEFGQDIIDRANAVSALRMTSSHFNATTGTLTVRFSGASELALSIVAMHADTVSATDLAVLDEMYTCATTSRDGRTFIELPPFEEGEHAVTVPFAVQATLPDDAPRPLASYRLRPYPNPTNASVRVHWDTDMRGAARVELWNLLGQRVMQREVTLTGEPVTWYLDLRDQASGAYLVRAVHPGTGMVRSQRITVIK